MRNYLLPFLFYLIYSQLGAQQRHYTLPVGINASDYDPTTIIVRVEPASHQFSKSGSSLKQTSLFNNIVANNVEPALPHLSLASATARNYGTHSLSNIYKITLAEGEDVISSINQLLKHESVIYAEPYFNYRPLDIPNDPDADPATGNQTHLSVIKAFDAWNIEKGDSSIVIGILDTGVDLEHEDLANNISYNYDDPINGIDDDNDGLIDNYAGWDIANNDNNPTADINAHGAEVSGVAAASTNNGIGIAGTGYKSRFLPIKIFSSVGNFFTNGYEAIALAADLGCHVINLSWGSSGAYSQFGQDVINYAVLEKNVAIVAAAGNTNQQLDFYPASYDNVLSVGATDNNDQKTSWATYSQNIDLMAPGQSVYTTTSGGYKSGQGSSFSSPLVAGTLALLRARYPSFTAQQIMEKVRVTADNIYNIPANASYIDLLGKGRLNMLKALTDNTSPSIRLEDFSYNNGLGPHAFYGDTLTIITLFKNYLAKTSSTATATVSTSSPYVSLLDSVFNLGELSTFDTISNIQLPFHVFLHDSLPPQTPITFKIRFRDSGYSDYQYFTIKSSPDYFTLNNGELAITIGSNGNLGYNEDEKKQGIGVTYQARNVLDNIGMISAISNSSVADNAPTELLLHERDKDFAPGKNVKLYKNSIAPLDLRNSFNDSSQVLQVKIEQKTLAWTDLANDNFVIFEYRVINTDTIGKADLHVAMFADWNLGNKDFNQAGWDETNQLGYIKDVESDDLYTGLVLLTDQSPIYFAINNKNFNGNIADISPLMDDDLKFDLVSQGVGKISAGDINDGNDVSHVLGGTIDTLGINQSEKVAIAIVAGASLTELQNHAAKAQEKYRKYLEIPPLLYTTYTCPGTPAAIDPPSGNVYEFYENISLSNLLATDNVYTTPPVNSTQTYYVINKDSTHDSDIFRVIAAPKPVAPDFSISSSPLLLDENGNTTVAFTDQSVDAVDWQWDFDNNYEASSVQHPLIDYTEPGNYNIQLTATSDLGCVDSITKSLEVAYRSNKPEIDDQDICQGTRLSLTATNATQLKVYSDPSLTNELYSGSSFNTDPMYQDVTYYITSTDSLYESNPAIVKVNVSNIMADFIYLPDTLDMGSKTSLQFNSKSSNHELYYWYIDNELMGVNEDIKFNYANVSSFQVKLIAEDANGCFDTLKQIINSSVSPAPIISKIDTCAKSSIRLTPTNGTYFHFYSDPALNNLIHKGTSMKINQVKRDTSIYITGIDNLLESSVVEASIHITQAKFSLTPESIGLGSIETLEIKNLSTAASDYTWLLNDDTLSTAFIPDLAIKNVGVYTIQLVAKSKSGCISSTQQTLEVVPITALSDDPSSEPMSFYPNPAYDRVYFSHATHAGIELLNTQGQLMANAVPGSSSLDIRHLPAGTYLIRMKLEGDAHYKKLIKSGD